MQYGVYYENQRPDKAHVGEAVVVRYRHQSQDEHVDNRWVYHMGNIIERDGDTWIVVSLPPTVQIGNAWGWVVPFNMKPIWHQWDDLITHHAQRNLGYEMQYMLVEA